MCLFAWPEIDSHLEFDSRGHGRGHGGDAPPPCLATASRLSPLRSQVLTSIVRLDLELEHVPWGREPKLSAGNTWPDLQIEGRPSPTATGAISRDHGRAPRTTPCRPGGPLHHTVKPAPYVVAPGAGRERSYKAQGSTAAPGIGREREKSG